MRCVTPHVAGRIFISAVGSSGSDLESKKTTNEILFLAEIVALACVAATFILAVARSFRLALSENARRRWRGATIPLGKLLKSARRLSGA